VTLVAEFEDELRLFQIKMRRIKEAQGAQFRRGTGHTLNG